MIDDKLKRYTKMVQVLLEDELEDGTCFLLEMQGTLETNEESMDGLSLGDLKVSQNGKTATLQIGHHLLSAKRVDLAKPLVLVKLEASNKLTTEQQFGTPVKTLSVTSSQLSPMSDVTTPSLTQNKAKKVHEQDGISLPKLKMERVIKYKYVFSSRPQHHVE